MNTANGITKTSITDQTKELGAAMSTNAHKEPGAVVIAGRPANDDREEADPRTIARMGHELAQVAVLQFRRLISEPPGTPMTPQEIEDMRSMASQLRIMADACVQAQTNAKQQRLPLPAPRPG